LHGIPRVVISDNDAKFTRNFWKDLFKGLDTQLKFSTAYHLQIDRQTKRVNQILEDMIRMYVMDKPGKWEEYLHLVEFAYNNHFQDLAKLSPFEILYGWKCNTPISWRSPIDRLMLGLELLKDMELRVKQVQHNLKAAQDMQKSYADLKRTPRNFRVGDHVFVKVKPIRSSLKLGRCTKLTPRYCGPFEILARVGLVAYQLTLPPRIQVHNFFHVSLLKRYVHNATHVVDRNVIQVEPEGEFQVEPEYIIDRRELTLWNRTIGQVKLQWKHLSPEEATWELEGHMREAYPILFQNGLEEC